MPNYDAVIFDLDGTLLDTLADLADSMNHVLERRGLPPHALAAYKRFVGDGIENLVLRALPEEMRTQDTIAGCLVEMRSEYGRRWADKTRPYDGIPALLDALVARGLKLAVLSNKPNDFTQLTVARLLPVWRFEAVVGLRAGAPRKPDPSSALQIVDALALPPQRFLYVGDTDTDMKTARAAGMYAVGALWGFRTAAELSANGAQSLIGRPEELLELL